MNTGLLLDNTPKVPQSSINKLRAMGAGCVGTLWTPGTKHGREVYDACEKALDHPFYIVRIGGPQQEPANYLSDCRALQAILPASLQGRVTVTLGNEPNIEWGASKSYGWAYSVVSHLSPLPCLFAFPSLGLSNWRVWLHSALAACGMPPFGIVNLYGAEVSLAAELRVLVGELYVGEVNILQGDRVAYLRQSFTTLAAAGVRGALIFIAGGKANGAWDERYIISEKEAEGVKGVYMSFEFELGFADYAKAHPEVGTPIEALQYDVQGNGWQHTTSGLLFWHKAANEVHWFPKA